MTDALQKCRACDDVLLPRRPALAGFFIAMQRVDFRPSGTPVLLIGAEQRRPTRTHVDPVCGA
jgi:hypothetical protein